MSDIRVHLPQTLDPLDPYTVIDDELRRRLEEALAEKLKQILQEKGEGILFGTGPASIGYKRTGTLR